MLPNPNAATNVGRKFVKEATPLGSISIFVPGHAFFFFSHLPERKPGR